MQKTNTEKTASTMDKKADSEDYIEELKSFSIRGLERMFMPEERRFVFCVRKTDKGIRKEGLSSRYTAISLIGLATLDEASSQAILHGQSREDTCRALAHTVMQGDNLGDVALTLWAAKSNHCLDQKDLIESLIKFAPDKKDFPTVELAWTLDALINENEPRLQQKAHAIAERLIKSQNTESGAFPHIIGTGKGLRHHVSCFADAVYPIHALSNYYNAYQDKRALTAAQKCADLICRTQGSQGQWWWHYDVRTGKVVEGYPVYSVHQDAMAPMALLALEEAGGNGYLANINKGLNWLAWSPEIEKSLVDKDADLIWRKVARREPNKSVRYLQAFSSRIHPVFRIPGVDLVFPPVSIDYENRPYHLGWILYSWSPKRMTLWNTMGK